ncbi:MAG: hypothetical protein EBT97_12325, partial [Actinobacteria bacterium]|nr:hypothetical protein [Actinomycetota bacterium]
MRRIAYSKPPGDQFQQSTFRTEKSVSGLPSGSDREKEQVLPEGSATPNSVSKDGKPADKAQGVGQRALPYGTFNGPSSGSGTVEKSRTKPVPGDQYGSPSKDDYGYLTRRTMTGADVEASDDGGDSVESDIVAYRPRKRGPSSYEPHAFGWRRHRQKPQQRNKRRKRYRLRRSRELQQARRLVDDLGQDLLGDVQVPLGVVVEPGRVALLGKLLLGVVERLHLLDEDLAGAERQLVALRQHPQELDAGLDQLLVGDGGQVVEMPLKARVGAAFETVQAPFDQDREGL